MAKTASLRPRPSVSPAGPMASLAGLLREWLPRQRWFAGKDRPVTDLGLLSMTELFPGCLHLLVHTGPSGVPAPSGAAPAGDCYQLLLGVRRHLSPRLGRALIGRAEEGPLAGLTVYDALQDPRSAQLLLERLRQPGAAGPVRFEADSSVHVPAGLVPRVLEAEQSNSSLVYGDEFILKVFRRVQPGVNPDLEVPGALAAQGCGRVPAPVAWFRTTHPQEATLGVLQPFLPDASDGWALALQALAAGDEFTVQARELGRATAEVHLALAAAFPAGAHDESVRTAAAMTERLDAAAHCVPSLRPYVPRLRTAFGALVACDPGPPAQRPATRGRPPSASTATCTWVRCCGPAGTGSSSTSRASRPDRSPSGAAPSPRCGTSRACCAPSTTPPGNAARGARSGRAAAARPTARGMPSGPAGTRARSTDCCVPMRPIEPCTRSCTKPGTGRTGSPYRWRRSSVSP